MIKFIQYKLGNLNPFRYRGYFYDTDSGFYYLHTRYYDPEVGRFISPDSVRFADPETIDGLNLYAYCGNDPVMGYDPAGTIATEVLILIGLIAGAAIGAVVGGVVAYSIAKNNGETGGELCGWTIFGIVCGAIIGGAIGMFIAWAAPHVASFLGTSFKLGSFVLASGQTVTVSITGGQAVAGVLGLAVWGTRIGKSGGYIIDHHYPNDHKPTHVHISGDDGFTKVDLKGEPIQGKRPMTPGERKAFNKLYNDIIKALFPWID